MFPTRRHLLLILSCATACLIAVGCGRERGEPLPDATPVPIRYVVLDRNTADEIIFDRFEAEHPDLEIEVETYAALPATYITGDNPPDIMYMTPGVYLDTSVATGLVADLSDLWEQSNLADIYPDNVRELSQQEGRQYFLPAGYTWTGLYYNQAVFDQFNLQPPTTWDELLVAADTLLAAGITPFAIAGDDTTLTSLWFNYLNYRLNGPEFHRQLLAGEVPFTDNRVQNVLATWVWLLDQGYFQPGAVTTDALTALMSTIRGDGGEVVREKTAMVLAGPGFLNELPEKFRDELAFVRFPILDPTLPVGEVVVATGYIVPTNAPHRNESMKFLQFMTSESSRELLSQRFVGEHIVPAMGFAGEEELPPEVRAGAAILSEADSLDVAFVFSMPLALQGELDRLFSRVLSTQGSGEVDIEGWLADLEAASQENQRR